jgi:hypothetical protein
VTIGAKRAAMGKEDFLPGQTKELNPNAPDTEALVTFYETLYQQRPDSEMAARFLLQHGLLPEDEAKKLVKKFGVKKGGGGSSSSGGAKAKPKASDDDFQSKPKPKPKKPPIKKLPADDSSDEEFVEQKAKAKAKPAPKRKPSLPADDSSDDDVPLQQKKKASVQQDDSSDEDVPLKKRKK